MGSSPSKINSILNKTTIKDKYNSFPSISSNSKLDNKTTFLVKIQTDNFRDILQLTKQIVLCLEECLDYSEDSNIKEEESLARIRHYDGAIEEAMYHDELDISIHDNLVKVVRNRLDVLHRYYGLKKKILKYGKKEKL